MIVNKLTDRRHQEKARPTDHRTPYEIDYARVIHSSSFRRLQSKTQVLGLGESDFYRTRLTHSLEVAQIGAGIVGYAKKKFKHLAEIQEILPEERCIEAICLAHDLGHPPFGHGGERALDAKMRPYGGFEGNAQTLRIITKLEKREEGYGLNPTRRLVLGVLKYPVRYGLSVVQSSTKPPKCFYDSEEDVVQWALEFFDREDVERFLSYSDGKKHKSRFVDTSIMELADDIAYSVHDLEDAIHLGFVSEKDWGSFMARKDFSIISQIKDISRWSGDLFSGDDYRLKDAIGSMVHYFISGIVIDSDDSFTSPYLRYNLAMSEESKPLYKFLQKVIDEKVIYNHKVQILERKGQKVIEDILKEMTTAGSPRVYLPSKTRIKYDDVTTDRDEKENSLNKDTARVICDYISGMTDPYAKKLHREFFAPDSGSIFEL